MPKGAKAAPPQQSSLQEMWGKRKRVAKQATEENDTKPSSEDPGPSKDAHDASANEEVQAKPSSSGKL